MKSNRSMGGGAEKHKAFIRGLPCTICGNPIETEWCHVRYADARAAKHETGFNNRADIVWTLPLCSRHHREQHAMNERAFWFRYSMDPIFICLALWRVSGNHELGEKILEAARS
jgi:hypothetical protein